ncbi:hypothetical protein ACVRXQ_13150 [Streptococcus panodentis]|uniref:Uncharacterized protein n=1 Tax=Streptococcus panodentis TaxID=1581472 RepID=A0ABS5B0B5_9STRE|nr:hypothetical protein [Streptococcus panodentis]MBP2622277.1 hypothetical protein [Streptococcus panodentis]
MARKKKTNIDTNLEFKKKTQVVYDPNSYKQSSPVWSFDLADFDHDEWSVLNPDFIEKEIFKALKSFESMTWQEIDSASGGKKKGTNNHFISFESMINEARNRADELKLLQHESLYSLRIQGKIRLFGVLNNGIYHIVWYDGNHAICPSGGK